MPTSYFIFKTNNSCKIAPVRHGKFKNERECRTYWKAFTDGIYDGCVEALGSGKFYFCSAPRDLVFHFGVAGKFSATYFMLLDKAGIDLMMEISVDECFYKANQ